MITNLEDTGYLWTQLQTDLMFHVSKYFFKIHHVVL